MASKRRTAYILEQHNRLANQLWNLAAIVAFCEERGYQLSDCAAVEYHRVLDVHCAELPVELAHRLLDPIISYVDHPKLGRLRGIRSIAYLASQTLRKVPRKLSAHPKGTHELCARGAFYLPPSPLRDPAQIEQLEAAENAPALGFSGFVFKNPVGLVKHRAAVLKHMRPRPPIARAVEEFTRSLRAKFTHLVGVHIRQGDYRSWLGGRFFVDTKAMRVALDELLLRRSLTGPDTVVVVCSDGRVDLGEFNGLNVVPGPGTVGTDLYALAECDLLLGSNSTFAAFAAFLGDIVHVIVEPSGVDWARYEGKQTFFENELAMLHLVPGSYESPLGDGSRVAP
jgi:hypothetical protein